MQRGKLIFLNGVTSTGKSTIAELIREMSCEILYTSSNDIFHDMVSVSRFDGNFWCLAAHSVIAQYHAVRGMINGGFHVVIDGMFLEREEYPHLFGKSHHTLFGEIFAGIQPVIVNLVCPPDELRRRNRVRGNRRENQSDYQLQFMAQNICPDLTLDVMTVMPDECAELILRCAGIPYALPDKARRERHRVHILEKLLFSFDAEITPTENPSLSEDASVIDTTVHTVRPDQSREIAVFLLLRGYSVYPKEYPGTILLERRTNDRLTEICRICCDCV
ncbi:MAG: AAA family ATPase [Clostridia bacterium]|nr:AAA family ATPase [Clostridia bacterium]